MTLLDSAEKILSDAYEGRRLMATEFSDEGVIRDRRLEAVQPGLIINQVRLGRDMDGDIIILFVLVDDNGDLITDQAYVYDNESIIVE